MKHKLIITLTLLFTILATSCTSSTPSAQDQPVLDYAKEAGFTIKSNDLKNADPGILYAYAHHLYQKGDKNEATFWYYVGQFRVRCHMSSVGENDTMDADLMKKVLEQTGLANDKLTVVGGMPRSEIYRMLMGILGQTINEYAFGDPTEMNGIVNNVLAYVDANPGQMQGYVKSSLVPSKEAYAEASVGVREGLLKLQDMLTNEQEHIRTERTKNGLENRN